MKKTLVTLLLAFSFHSALAHSKVIGVYPSARAVVKSPKYVSVKLNEAVKLKFCKLNVYKLNADGGKLAINRAAAQVAKTGKAVRMPIQFNQQGKSNTLKASIGKLPAGNYVMAWRVLSADGHMVRGHSVFKAK